MTIRLAAGLTLALLLAATLYQALVALGAIELGELPGEGPAGDGIVRLAAAVGIVAAAVTVAGVASMRSERELVPALLAPAAAAYLVATFYTFDPYYLPTLIRFADRDFVSPALVLALAGGAVAAGVLAFLRTAIGLWVSAPLIVACGITAWWAGAGH